LQASSASTFLRELPAVLTAWRAVVTLLLAVLAERAAAAGSPLLSQALFWPNSLLQAPVPLQNIGTPEHPLYEGTPLNFLAYFAGYPFGLLVYGAIAYACLALRHRVT
jgi:hypothetical protein